MGGYWVWGYVAQFVVLYVLVLFRNQDISSTVLGVGVCGSLCSVKCHVLVLFRNRISHQPVKGFIDQFT